MKSDTNLLLLREEAQEGSKQLTWNKENDKGLRMIRGSVFSYSFAVNTTQGIYSKSMTGRRRRRWADGISWAYLGDGASSVFAQESVPEDAAALIPQLVLLKHLF